MISFSTVAQIIIRFIKNDTNDCYIIGNKWQVNSEKYLVSRFPFQSSQLNINYRHLFHCVKRAQWNYVQIVYK